MQFVNEHDVSLLMTGSDDGTVRLWSNYVPRENREPELVTAWQALPDITPSNRSINGNFCRSNQRGKDSINIAMRIKSIFDVQGVLESLWSGSRRPNT